MFYTYNELFFHLPWHPFYSATAGILCGIGWYVNVPLGLALSLCAFCIHVFFRIPAWYVAGLCFLGGMALGIFRAQQQENRYLRACAATQQKLTIEGTITNITTDETGQATTILITSAQAKKQARSALNGWSLTIRHPINQALQIGQQLRWENLFLRPPSLEHSFSNYCLQKNHLGSVKTTELPRPLPLRPTLSFEQYWSTLRAKIVDHIARYTDTETVLLIRSIVLGDKTALQESTIDYRSQFQYWGISHYLARSGLHISTIIFLVVFICSLIIPNHTMRIILAMIFSILFSLVSWNSVSYLRALSFVLILFLGTLRKRSTHALVIFSIVTSLTLLQAPHVLLALDFQLSFLLSGVLLWYTQINFFTSLANTNSAPIR